VPQLAGSVSKRVQNAAAPAPQASGVAGAQRQAPPRHCWEPGHFTPQPPQLLASPVVSAQ
jgi:hypothetical protein